MNYIQRSSRWKIILVVSGIIVVLISLFYTNFLAKNLAEGEKDKVQIFALSFESLNKAPLDADVALEQQLIEKVTKSGIPLILTDKLGNVQEGYNYGDRNDDIEFLEKELESIKKSGNPPVRGSGYAAYIYYSNTFTYTLLTYFPLVQVLLLASFLGIGYVVFTSIKKSEQNQIWVGLAKETAHQLGTPISSIMAWLELLKTQENLDGESKTIVGEIKKDVNRLELISDRFSKIGSKPELEKTNLTELLENSAIYMKKRASSKISFEYPTTSTHSPYFSNVNSSLFEWVVENLIRNALDALDGKGKLQLSIEKKNTKIVINVMDNGKGIPSDKRKTVFKPGYSTKKRGWGLGLSLSKRIIESYHDGRIYVKSSVEDKGTTFAIELAAL